jgi:hypothetical protein
VTDVGLNTCQFTPPRVGFTNRERVILGAASRLTFCRLSETCSFSYTRRQCMTKHTLLVYPLHSLTNLLSNVSWENTRHLQEYGVAYCETPTRRLWMEVITGLNTTIISYSMSGKAFDSGIGLFGSSQRAHPFVSREPSELLNICPMEHQSRKVLLRKLPVSSSQQVVQNSVFIVSYDGFVISIAFRFSWCHDACRGRGSGRGRHFCVWILLRWCGRYVEAASLTP